MSRAIPVPRWMRHAALIAAAACIASLPARGEGPVAPGAVPGGVQVVDSDTGNGQAWGRTGGRTITFTVNQAAQFSTLHWGVVANTNPSLAFDGAVSNSTGEVMSFSAAQSNLGVGFARWVGNAALTLANFGTIPSVPTRFTLVVTRNGQPVPLVNVGGGVSPGVNVLAAAGTFTANLLFEMQNPTNGLWGPVLTVYDTLETPPGQPPSTNQGPVMTGVSTGFYYTSSTGLTLEQHDAHITGLLAPIGNNVSFLRTDVPNRLQGLSTDMGEVRSQVTNAIPSTLSQIQQQVTQILNSSGGSSDTARRSDIQDLQQTLLILWGLMPCPAEAGPLCASAKFIQHLATQASVDTLAGKVDALQLSLDAVAGAALKVQVVAVDGAAKQARWLVHTTLEGAPVPATVAALSVVRTNGPAAMQDVTGMAVVTQVAPGLHEVTLNRIRDVSDGSAYVFRMRLGAGAATIEGATMVEAPK